MKMVFFVSLMSFAVATFIRAYIYTLFAKHFPDVEFGGRWVLPSRRFSISEVQHSTIRKILYAIKGINTVALTTMGVTAILIVTSEG